MKEDQPNATEKAIPAPPGNARNTSYGRRSRDIFQINGQLDTTRKDGMLNTRGTQVIFTTYRMVVSSRNMSTHPNIRQCTGQTALSEPVPTWRQWHERMLEEKETLDEDEQSKDQTLQPRGC